MGPLLRIFSVLLLLALLFYLEVYSSPEKAYNKCEKRCLQRRDRCSVKCRARRIKNTRRKMRVLDCLYECSLNYFECEGECSCYATCAREIIGCRQSCRVHPFIYRGNKHQCVEECHHENEYCRDICWKLK